MSASLGGAAADWVPHRVSSADAMVHQYRGSMDCSEHHSNKDGCVEL